MIRSKLPKILNDAGLTQGELASRSGMNRTNINMLVRGARVPTLESALKIAWVLGVPVEHIWSIPGPKRRRKS